MSQTAKSTSKQELPELSLGMLVTTIWRRLVLIAGVTAGFVVLAGALSFIQKPKFESYGALFISESKQLVLSGSVLTVPPPSQELLISLVESRSLRLELDEKLSLRKDPDFWGGELPEEEPLDVDVINRLDTMITVEEDPARPIIYIRVRSIKPKLAYDMATSLLEDAVDRVEALEHKESQFLQSQLDLRIQAFNEAVKSLKEFQEEHGLVTEPVAQGQAYFEAALRLKEERLRKETELAEVRGMLDVPVGLESSLGLMSRKGGLDGAVDFLNAKDAASAQRLEEIPEVAEQYTLISSQLEMQRAMLKVTVEKVEMARIEAESKSPKIVVLDEPRFPQKPVSSLLFALVIGFLVGGVLGVTLAVFLDFLAAEKALTT